MFERRNQLVKQAQLEDWRVEVEKERLLQQVQAHSQQSQQNPIRVRRSGLLFRLILALSSRLASKPHDDTKIWDITPGSFSTDNL